MAFEPWNEQKHCQTSLLELTLKSKTCARWVHNFFSTQFSQFSTQFPAGVQHSAKSHLRVTYTFWIQLFFNLSPEVSSLWFLICDYCSFISLKDPQTPMGICTLRQMDKGSFCVCCAFRKLFCLAWSCPSTHLQLNARQTCDKIFIVNSSSWYCH